MLEPKLQTIVDALARLNVRGMLVEEFETEVTRLIQFNHANLTKYSCLKLLNALCLHGVPAALSASTDLAEWLGITCSHRDWLLNQLNTPLYRIFARAIAKRYGIPTYIPRPKESSAARRLVKESKLCDLHWHKLKHLTKAEKQRSKSLLERSLDEELRMCSGAKAGAGEGVGAGSAPVVEGELLQDILPIIEGVCAGADRENIAVRCRDVTLTYAELNKQANQLANQILKYAAGESLKDQVIAILFSDTMGANDYVQVMVSMLAVLKTGAAFSFLQSYQGEEVGKGIDTLRYAIKILQPYLVISNEAILDWSRDRRLLTGCHIQNWHDPSLRGQSTENLPAIVDWQDRLAYVTFTSGSTGKPKGAEITRQALYARVKAHQDIANIKPDEAIAQHVPFSIDAAIIEMLWPLCIGSTCVMIPACRNHVRYFAQDFKKYGVTAAIFVPNILKALKPENFPGLRVLLSVGDKIEQPQIQLWLDKSPAREFIMINGYGPSEVTIGCSLKAYRKGDSTKVTIGKAMCGTAMSICTLAKEPDDEDFVPVLQDDPTKEGEIVISGMGLMRGYHQIPGAVIGAATGTEKEELIEQQQRLEKLNRERLELIAIDGQPAYRTGDKGRVDEETGDFLIFGRIDRQFKRGGRLINPEEIEDGLDRVKKKEPAIYGSISLVGVEVDLSDKYKRVTAVLCGKDERPNFSFHDIASSLSGVVLRHLLPARWAWRQVIGESEEDTNWKGRLKGAELREAARYGRLAVRHDAAAVDLAADALATEIKGMWENVLLSEAERKLLAADPAACPELHIGIHDRFDLLGGDSLAYMEMQEAFIHKFGLFPTEAFAQEQTIKCLINFVQKFVFQRVVFGDSDISGSRSIYLVHALFGNAQLDYSEVANCLYEPESGEYDYRVIGFNIELCMKSLSISQIAKKYAQLLTQSGHSVSDRRPCVVVGWSTGGVLALEMAKVLRRRGMRAHAILIDTACPKIADRVTNTVDQRKVLMFLIQQFRDKFNIRYSDEQIRAELDRIFSSGRISWRDAHIEILKFLDVKTPPQNRQRFIIAKNLLLAELDCGGDNLSEHDYLMVAKDAMLSLPERNLTLGWHMRDERNVIRVDGDHRQAMLNFFRSGQLHELVTRLHEAAMAPAAPAEIILGVGAGAGAGVGAGVIEPDDPLGAELEPAREETRRLFDTLTRTAEFWRRRSKMVRTRSRERLFPVVSFRYVMESVVDLEHECVVLTIHDTAITPDKYDKVYIMFQKFSERGCFSVQFQGLDGEERLSGQPFVVKLSDINYDKMVSEHALGANKKKHGKAISDARDSKICSMM